MTFAMSCVLRAHCIIYTRDMFFYTCNTALRPGLTSQLCIKAYGCNACSCRLLTTIWRGLCWICKLHQAMHAQQQGCWMQPPALAPGAVLEVAQGLCLSDLPEELCKMRMQVAAHTVQLVLGRMRSWQMHDSRQSGHVSCLHVVCQLPAMPMAVRVKIGSMQVVWRISIPCTAHHEYTMSTLLVHPIGGQHDTRTLCNIVTQAALHGALTCVHVSD